MVLRGETPRDGVLCFLVYKLFCAEIHKVLPQMSTTAFLGASSWRHLFTMTYITEITEGSPPDDSFIANILKPGSSLHPTFLLIVDGAFSFLLFVFIILAFLTAGNIHIFALIGIEMALWASVKWYVNMRM